MGEEFCHIRIDVSCSAFQYLLQRKELSEEHCSILPVSAYSLYDAISNDSNKLSLSLFKCIWRKNFLQLMHSNMIDALLLRACSYFEECPIRFFIEEVPSLTTKLFITQIQNQNVEMLYQMEQLSKTPIGTIDCLFHVLCVSKNVQVVKWALQYKYATPINRIKVLQHFVQKNAHTIQGTTSS